MKLVKRPWGVFNQFILNKKCTVKILKIKPNQKLSLQLHKKRKELWYFLTPGTIQTGKLIKNVKKEEIVNIPKNKPHRIIAKNKEVVVLEVSFGNFNEKDEVRLDDKYGRK